jgi:hypothetical protein
LRKRAYRLLATALSAAVFAACSDGQSPTSEPLTTEPVTGAEDGEVDLEAAEARAEDLLGRSEDEVADLPDVRVVRRDGEDLDLTMDLVPGRMNVTVEDGVVVDVSVERDAGPPPIEPFREDATFASDRIVLSTDRAEPGEVIEVEWPEEDERGLGYVLELQVGDAWDLRYFMVAGTESTGEHTEWWAVDDAEGRGWDDIGIGGPGPDLIEIPDIAELGSYRVCNHGLPHCAPLEVGLK